MKAFKKILADSLFTEKAILWDIICMPVVLYYSLCIDVSYNVWKCRVYVHYPEVLATSGSVEANEVECWDRLDTLSYNKIIIFRNNWEKMKKKMSSVI